MSADQSALTEAAGSTADERVKPPLDDIMLAMDVVDTLRRAERLVTQELDEAGREQDLKQRLHRIYAAQGIEVPDHVIEQGVAALKEERFTYSPPRKGLRTRLARLYVSRGRWGKWAMAAIVVPVIAWVASYFTFIAPNADLPERLTGLHAEIVELAKSDRARESANRLMNAGKTALRDENNEAAKESLTALETLRTSLEQEYTVRIVNRPEARSGLWRIPDVNSKTRNYYIVVEAIDPSGKPLQVAIENEETNQTELVDTWALRVDEDTFTAVAKDKQDDGIIERDRFGYKHRGYLLPEYEMETTGGAITKW